ncbi:hypothetical protein Pcac1_g13905 [Phytophthora cactorum]|nr:hypothetical protein Pcac1_g13905 [Phytophthora cactorum]
MTLTRTADIDGMTDFVAVLAHRLRDPRLFLSWTFPSLDTEAAKIKLEVRQVDFNSLSAADIKPSDKVDAAFWCMGTTRKDAGSADTFRKVDLEYVIKSAEVSKAADVPYMDLLTSQGANKNI